MFPGWLSKTYFGAKHQLGDTLFGSLSANGSMNGLYTPPPSSLVRYVGATPLVEHSALAIDSEDVYSTLKMPYRISDDAQGNVTIEVIQFQNLTGNPFLPTEGNALTGHYNINSNGQQNDPYRGQLF